MATNPVKFYAVKEMPTENVNASGIYFVAGTDGMPGRIYKGNTLFGSAIVTQIPDSANVQNPVRGDVNIGDAGAQIYDGTEWLSLSANQTQIENLIMENINKMFDGLVGYEPTKYEKTVEELENLVNTEDNGWTKDSDGNYLKDGVKVADKDGNKLDTDGKVIPNKDASYVDADKVTTDEVNAGTITATGDITTEGKVEAGTVTADAINIKEDEDSDPTPIDEYVISKIEDGDITSDDNDNFSVQVTTSAGKVTDVVVTAPELVDEIPEEEIDKDAEGYKDTIATTAAIKAYVDGKFTNIDTPMDFVGAVSEFPENPNNGDVIVFTTPEEGKEVYIKDGAVVEKGTEGAVEVKPGQEYIYSNGKWEQIGDQNALASLAGAVDTLNGDADTEGSVDNKVQSAIDALTGESGVSGSDTVDGETEATATITIKAGEDGALAPEIDINEATKIRDAKPVVAEGEEAPEAPAEGYADDANLATELAVRQAIASAMQSMEMVWLDEDGNALNS